MLKQREAKARAKLQAAMAELRRVQSMEKRQAKKREDNRKILAGAFVLEHATRDANFEAWLTRELDRFLTRPRERELFGFAGGETGETTTPDAPAMPEQNAAAAA